jgi:hypothetical protein
MRFLHPNILNNISRGIFCGILIIIFLLFSWNPAGALRSGKNPAVYKFLGETIHVDGKSVTVLFLLTCYTKGANACSPVLPFSKKMAVAITY